MSYIRGEDREQASFLPARIDDYVGAEAAVRVIDAFAEGLNAAGLGFVRAVPAATGQPGYDPRDLLKLYVYGCQISSFRANFSCARPRRVAGCATQTGSPGHASATARLKLAFHLDHS